MSIKSTLFPFYKEHHRFLLEKWWFRLLILVYIFAIISSPFIFASVFVESNTDWCWRYVSHLTNTGADFSVWENAKAHCNFIHQEIMPWAITIMVTAPIFLHYLIQLLFFKVAVDFVALGRFKSPNK